MRFTSLCWWSGWCIAGGPGTGLDPVCRAPGGTAPATCYAVSGTRHPCMQVQIDKLTRCLYLVGTVLDLCARYLFARANDPRGGHVHFVHILRCTFFTRFRLKIS
jgi:hypothetical protein